MKPICEGEKPTENDTQNGAPPALVFHKPGDLNTNQAAVFLMAYLPAYLLLHKVACVRSGDVVLVHSAGGGVVSLYFNVYL